MQPVEFNIDYKELNIQSQEIEEIIGFQEIPEPIANLIYEVLEEYGNHCKIKGGYSIQEKINLDHKNYILMAGDVGFEIGKIIINQLKQSKKIALFLCTAGKGITEWAKAEMATGDLLKGYIIDMVGSLIVDKALDIIQKKLEEDCLAQKLKITNRFSPGYCGWLLKEQHKLFSFFPSNFCGITLTESSLMQPAKSISGIIGIGAKVRFNPYSCGLCEMEDCGFRKK